MVDQLRSGTRAAETIIGGMFGGSTFSIVSDGSLGLDGLFWILVMTVAAMALFIGLHWWYEIRRGEPIA